MKERIGHLWFRYRHPRDHATIQRRIHGLPTQPRFYWRWFE